MRPIVAVRAMRELFANPDDTQQVFEIIEALQGPSLLRLRTRLRKSEQGRQLLAEQPDLAFTHHETRNIGIALIATIAWFKLGRITDASIEARHINRCALTKST